MRVNRGAGKGFKNGKKIKKRHIDLQVFATMSSLQALAPIVGTALYTSVYNATADLPYPWQASYLLNSVGLFTTGKYLSVIIISVNI